MRDIVTENRLESSLNTFYTNIDKCLDKACPKEMQKSVDKNNPWWNPEIDDMRRHLNKLYKKKNRHPTQHNINEYKDLKTKFARTCRQAQTKGWNEFTDSTDSFDKMNVLRKNFRREKLAHRPRRRHTRPASKKTLSRCFRNHTNNIQPRSHPPENHPRKQNRLDINRPAQKSFQ